MSKTIIGVNEIYLTLRLHYYRRSDIVMVRRGRALEKMMLDQQLRSLVQAQVIFWDQATDVLSHFISITSSKV